MNSSTSTWSIRKQRHMLVIALCAGGVLAFVPGLALAKRAAPKDVAPVTAGGVRYEAPVFDTACGQIGGCVVAYDATSNKRLWFVKVYCTHYDSRETDVQDVYITALAIEDGQLSVQDKKDRNFSIDLSSRAVSGDENGCGPQQASAGSGGGCAVSQMSDSRSVVLLSVLLIGCVWLSRRRSAARRA